MDLFVCRPAGKRGYKTNETEVHNLVDAFVHIYSHLFSLLVAAAVLHLAPVSHTLHAAAGIHL